MTMNNMTNLQKWGYRCVVVMRMFAIFLILASIFLIVFGAIFGYVSMVGILDFIIGVILETITRDELHKILRRNRK